MTKTRWLIAIFILAVSLPSLAAAKANFVTRHGRNLYLNGHPYLFIGANYWYGALLPLEDDPKRGIGRLRRELDLLKRHGVTNLRVMAGAEGSGPMNGIERVGPPIQPAQGAFDERVLRGLDVLLAEIGKRDMKAVIYLSNNWEWSGGFQQYLIWNHVVPSDLLTRRPAWDELRDTVSKFYSCEACAAGYRQQVATIVGRKNSVTGVRYNADPAIMAWEIANEPRPMRPAANEVYLRFIRESAAYIRSLDAAHLITTGHEGSIGTESLDLFERVHADPNVDYVTIHIWPKNWGWFRPGHLADDVARVNAETDKYIGASVGVATALDKPLVIEEFGLPRDGDSLGPASSTTLRDAYYERILGNVGENNGVAGANFWAFGGLARRRKGQPFWRRGDDLMGDPPMEEQGLNSVFDTDASTWRVLSAAAERVNKREQK